MSQHSFLMLVHLVANFVVQEQESWSASQEDRSCLSDSTPSIDVTSTGNMIHKAQIEWRARPSYISFVKTLLRRHSLLSRRWALCARRCDFFSFVCIFSCFVLFLSAYSGHHFTVVSIIFALRRVNTETNKQIGAYTRQLLIETTNCC